MKNQLILLEASDVARELDLSYSGVRGAVDSGRLVPFARTRRGVKLFKPDAVESFKRTREEEARRRA